MTDQATKKWAAIGKIACALSAILSEKYIHQPHTQAQL